MSVRATAAALTAQRSFSYFSSRTVFCVVYTGSSRKSGRAPGSVCFLRSPARFLPSIE